MTPPCRFSAAALALAVLAGLAQSAHAQAPSSPFPRLQALGEVGPAWGAGNRFTDFALTGGVRVRRVALRLRMGSFLHLAGCATIFPTKCGAGADGYYDATVAVHIGRDAAGVAAWTMALGPGIVRAGHRPYLSAAIGRDFPLGRRGLFRIELHGRHVVDEFYRSTWHEPHRQVGLRFGLGLWSAVDRL